MIQMKNLDVHYGKTRVLKGIDLRVNKGEIVSVLGPNGVGKTTLLKCLLGMIKPGSGFIKMDDLDILKMSLTQRARFIGYVPQALPSRFPMTVFDAVLMGRKPYVRFVPSGEDLEIVSQVLLSMNLSHLALKEFDRISGGQKQKVLLARAIAQEPCYLILDEPSSNLDVKHQLEVMDMLKTLAAKKNIGIIMAMHSLNLAARFSDRIVMLKSGHMVCNGPPAEVMTCRTIEMVYGILVTINRANGYPYTIPLSPVPVNKINSELLN
ncbi:MAG: ABC transporter ATP-binding protein [Proteobacteria bacterium]|nr:ABC transporter ATP-binding protein [Pseudomonadota bacterium]MBU1584833.1 ABC transporter ATP-binding protein [Pseudomonadota bacterium]MBU2452550.1 ABC transporter ATP-binding protein [Pseudomonadota bacterium]MBU2632050.1 ABC transporter ATP-binding protein [Pseudomonadota bacterium]